MVVIVIMFIRGVEFVYLYKCLFVLVSFVFKLIYKFVLVGIVNCFS